MVSCSGRWEDFKRLPSKKSVYPMCLPSSAEQRRKLSTRRNKVACCERKPLMGKAVVILRNTLTATAVGWRLQIILTTAPFCSQQLLENEKSYVENDTSVCQSDSDLVGYAEKMQKKKCHISASSPKNTHRQILLCLRIFSR